MAGGASASPVYSTSHRGVPTPGPVHTTPPCTSQPGMHPSICEPSPQTQYPSVEEQSHQLTPTPSTSGGGPGPHTAPKQPAHPPQPAPPPTKKNCAPPEPAPHTQVWPRAPQSEVSIETEDWVSSPTPAAAPLQLFLQMTHNETSASIFQAQGTPLPSHCKIVPGTQALHLNQHHTRRCGPVHPNLPFKKALYTESPPEVPPPPTAPQVACQGAK